MYLLALITPTSKLKIKKAKVENEKIFQGKKYSVNEFAGHLKRTIREGKKMNIPEQPSVTNASQKLLSALGT